MAGIIKSLVLRSPAKSGGERELVSGGGSRARARFVCYRENGVTSYGSEIEKLPPTYIWKICPFTAFHLRPATIWRRTDEAFAADRPAALSLDEAAAQRARLRGLAAERVAPQRAGTMASSSGEHAMCERKIALGWPNCLAQADASGDKLRVEREILENRGLALQTNQGVVSRTMHLHSIKKGIHVQALRQRYSFQRPATRTIRF